MIRTLRRASTLVCAIGILTSSAMAETASFKVSFGGVRAGVLAYDGTEQNGRYKVTGAARPSGLLGAMLEGRIDAASNGRVSGNSYAPSASREFTQNDSKTVERLFRYSNGIPAITRTPARKKPQRHAAPVAQQKGTLDTTTAAFAILRDRPESLACKLNIEIFDGAKRHRIRLDQAKKTSNGLICTGIYSRVAGFSPEEMAERRDWPLRLDYKRNEAGMMQVDGLSFATSFGKARIRRR